MKSPKINITVDLDEFPEEQLKEYVASTYGMFEDLEDVETCLLIEELQDRGVAGLEIYDYNILLSGALEKIIQNIEKIPLEEFEQIINKYDL